MPLPTPRCFLAMSRDIYGCHTGGIGVLLASSAWSPGMLLYTCCSVQDRPPSQLQGIIQLKISIVHRLTNPVLGSFLFTNKQNGTINFKTYKNKTISIYLFSFKQWKIEVIFLSPKSQKQKYF